MNGITVVIPTVGRKSLGKTLSSVAYQLGPQDAACVISDGKNDAVKELVISYAELFTQPDWTYDWIEASGTWGHPAANHALEFHAKTTHVWRIDDDDEAAFGAIDAMREHLEDDWTVFKMTFGEGHRAKGLTCWRQKQVRYGDVGTPMILARTSSARFGWKYEGDFDYAQGLQRIYGEPEWDERVVAIIRPAADVSLVTC